MSSPIFMLRKDGEIIPMTEQPFELEGDLQHLLAEHPEILLSDYLGERDLNLLLVKREATIPGDEQGQNTFYLDHLFLDQEGIPTLVEVKRSTDTRIRREVVGQMLDYAANALLYWPVEEIRGMFNLTCNSLGKKPEKVLGEFLGADTDPDIFWNNVKKNLLSGNIRIIFAADSIPDSLKNIVQFLNNQMNPAEVLAVDVRQFVWGDLQVIVPKVIGQSTQAVQRKNPVQKRKWNEQDFLAELEKNTSKDEVNIAKKLLAWAKRRDLRIWWGEGAKTGSLIPMVIHKEKYYLVVSFMTSGKGDIQFQFMKNYPPFSSDKRRLQFLNMINTIPGVKIPADKIAAQPSYPIHLLKSKAAFDQYIRALDYFVEEIRRI